MSSCLPRIVPCNFCTFKQNSNTECRKYFAVCCLQNSEQRMLHQGNISSTGARFLNPSWFWVIPNKIFSPHHKSWLILCLFLSLTNIFILHITERAQARLETKTEVTTADSSRAKTTKHQHHHHHRRHHYYYYQRDAKLILLFSQRAFLVWMGVLGLLYEIISTENLCWVGLARGWFTSNKAS